MTQATVKQCPNCSTEFSLAELLAREDVQPIGMSFLPGSLEDSLYFFNHICPGCGTTFTVPIELFAGVIEEPIPEEVPLASPECGGHCTRVEDLTDCKARCSNAPYRRFLVEVLIPRGRAQARGQRAR